MILAGAAIALWNATYLERDVAALRAGSEEVPEEYLRNLSPLEWEHVILTPSSRLSEGIYARCCK
jgi:Tn3 transposase DDE domain